MANSKLPESFKLVVLGGGTGSFVLLSALKNITPNITAIVSMFDDGGSTGVLRDELGVLPPGDARQCLVALSGRPEVRDLFNYRFSEGRLEGQSLGNIILSGLELQHGSFDKAVEVASRVLRIRGQVAPVALGNHALVMRDGEDEIVGQHTIDLHTIKNRDVKVRIEPISALNPKAELALREADMIVIAPGSFYTSILPIFSVSGIASVFNEVAGKVVFVANLVNKARHTPGWHIVDYVHKLEERIGVGAVDIVLYNNEPISEDLLLRYAEEGDTLVDTSPERFSEIKSEVRAEKLVSKTIFIQDQADKAIKRTLIRHDGDRAAEVLLSLYKDSPSQ